MQYQFYNHPFIDLIIEDRWISKHGLFKRSGIREKSVFNKEFNRLIKEGHIQKVYGKFYLATLSLSVSIKQNRFDIDRIPIKYIPQNELKTMYGFVQSEREDNFEFHLFFGYNPIEEKSKIEFEKLIGFKLDTDYYEYNLIVEYIDLTSHYHYEEEDTKKNITIMLMDDNHIFADELKKNLEEKYLQDVTWLHFSHPDDAIRVLENKFIENDPVNLIITNVDLIGLDGYQFAKIIRELEIDHNYFHIPVIAISNDANSETLLNKGLEEKVFSYYLKKTNNFQMDIRNICNYIKAAFWSNIFLWVIK